MPGGRSSGRGWDRPSKELKRWLRYWSLRIVLEPLASAPLGAARRLGRLYGDLAWAMSPRLRRRALSHLELAFPDWTPHRRRETARAVNRWIGSTGADVLHLGSRQHQELLDSIQVEGREHWPEDPGPGRGILVVGGHLGNWELLAAWLAGLGRPMRVFYHPFREERLSRLVQGIRARAGVTGLPADGSPIPAVRALRRGEAVGVIIDRVPRGRAVACRFFGREVRTAPGAAWLALTTGSPVVPAALVRQGEGYRLSLRPPLDPGTGNWGSREEGMVVLTRRMTSILEEQIREAPEQWPWFYDRWKIRPGELLGGPLDD